MNGAPPSLVKSPRLEALIRHTVGWQLDQLQVLLNERGLVLEGHAKCAFARRLAQDEAVRRGGRDQVGCIVLGRGEDDAKVREWLTTAAGVPGFIGFAVGRTTFWNSLVDYRAGKIKRDVTVERIAASYRTWGPVREVPVGDMQSEVNYGESASP